MLWVSSWLGRKLPEKVFQICYRQELSESRQSRQLKSNIPLVVMEASLTWPAATLRETS